MKILFCSLFLLFSFSCFPRKIQASSETKFHTLDLGSQLLQTTSTCDHRPFKAGLKNNIVEVVNGYGPCAHDHEEASDSSSKQTLNIISLADILVHDQLRVNSIQARVVANTNKTKVDKQSQPLRAVLGFGNYTVTLGLGTPKQNVTLIFDTGSDVTWTQCQPCSAQYCYPQKEPLFKPSASTTYSEVPCNSSECAELGKYNGAYCSDEHKCLYGADYGDGSYTTGIYSSDTLTATDAFCGFRFGCGQKNNGSFGKASGLLGLSRGPVSFVSQTANKYARFFSYCLPPNIRSNGFLRFGKYNNKTTTTKMVYTTLVPGPPPTRGYPPSTFYYIEITGISVGGARLNISESVLKTERGSIIDSGTVITRLPPEAYNETKKEFKKQMRRLKYRSAGAYGILDTCFDISRHATKTNITKIRFPTMSITFKGNATVHLAPSGIVWVVNSTLACLAFAGNNNSEDLVIFGSTQQRKLEVMYDVAENKLGFLPNPKCVSE